MGFLNGATIITLAVVVVCILVGIGFCAAWFGAAMSFAFIVGLFIMGLFALIYVAIRKAWCKFLSLFSPKNNPMRQL